MIEESDQRIAVRDQASEDRYGEAMIYDFSKFLISLSLLVLGAMLTLSQAARAGDIKLGNIVLVVGSISLAAVFAFSAASKVVDARAKGEEPTPKVRIWIRAATGMLGVGIGGFLMLWMDTLS